MALGRIVAAHVSLLFPTVTFAIWNVLAESVHTDGVDVLILCAVKDATALFALLMALLVTRWHRSIARQSEDCTDLNGHPSTLKDWTLLAIVGLTAPFFASLATVVCAAWAGGNTVGILNALAPAIASTLVIILGFEKCSWFLILGVLMASGSGVLAVSESTSQPSRSRPQSKAFVGTMFGLAMAVAQAIFFIAMKPLFQPTERRKAIPANIVIGLAYAFATTVSVCCCLLLIAAKGVDFTFASWDVHDTWKACFAGLICGALNYSLLTWACQVLPVTICSIYGALQPPITALIAFAAKAEALTRIGYISMSLAVLSVVLVSCERSESTQSTQPLALEECLTESG